MYISLNWINDYVDLSGVDIKKLINQFTLSCAEVEGVIEKGKDIKNVVTGRILSVTPHPNSKKLHLLKVDVQTEVLDIVCGAPNVQEGRIAAVALIGGRVGLLDIAQASIAGVISNGMCCSGKELGISDDDSGLFFFDEGTPIGENIKNILDIDDVIFEVDNKSLTNRPDMWGHYGMAREIATLLKRPLKEVPLWEEKSNLPAIKVNVLAKQCYRYCAAAVTNITRKTSPQNMQIRLYYTGMRKINFLTDLTNYVMLEFGQPMHAFDYAKINSIEVDTTTAPTNFITLDEKPRTLPAGTTVIKSEGEVVAVAGVMGGLKSSVTDSTNSVLIESACFDGYSVRKTSSALNLRTESSARYEKSLDPNLAQTSLKRLIYLLKKYDNNAIIASSMADVYNYKYPQLSIAITKKYIDDFIGVEISEGRMLDILTRLEFEVLTKAVGEYKVMVPSFRATKDIGGRADIVEEIARMYGYDNIQPKSVAQPVTPLDQNKEVHLEYEVKHMLAARYNLHEVHSYIWYDATLNKELGITPKSVIKIVNSIQKDNNQVRSTLVPAQLKVVMENKNEQDSIGVFEIGRVVKRLDTEGNVVETKSLTITKACKTARERLIIDLKNTVQYLFKIVVRADVRITKGLPKEDYINPANYYEVFSKDERLGFIGFIHPRIEKHMDKKLSIAVAELDFSKIIQLDSKPTMFEEVSKFQKCQLDFSFLVNKNTLYEDVEKIAYSIKVDYDYNVELLDIYDANENYKSYTLRYIMCSDCRTLTGKDLEDFHKRVLAAFEEKGIELKDTNLNCPT